MLRRRQAPTLDFACGAPDAVPCRNAVAVENEWCADHISETFAKKDSNLLVKLLQMAPPDTLSPEVHFRLGIWPDETVRFLYVSQRSDIPANVMAKLVQDQSPKVAETVAQVTTDPHQLLEIFRSWGRDYKRHWRVAFWVVKNKRCPEEVLDAVIGSKGRPPYPNPDVVAAARQTLARHHDVG